MRFLTISDAASGMTATIAPEYGGMVTGLTLADGRKVLRLDERILSMAPMLAGGMPVLFPFASKTQGDVYHVDGVQYRMPFHGLVKNAAFAVGECSAASVSVWMEGSPLERACHYPFDYRLTMTYRFRNGGLEAEAAIHNRGGSRLPHSFGWHPFFLASDKTALTFTHHLRGRYNYTALRDEPAPAGMDLSLAWDDVLTDPEEYAFRLDNPADGYRVRCRYGTEHATLIVCTTTEQSVCIEPWCGLPDSVNCGRLLRFVDPGETERIWLRLEAEAL